jgi:hypothetical protein
MTRSINMALMNTFAESYWLLSVRDVVLPVTPQAGFKKKKKHEENWHLKCVYSSPSRQIELFTQKRIKSSFWCGKSQIRTKNNPRKINVVK